MNTYVRSALLVCLFLCLVVVLIGCDATSSTDVPPPNGPPPAEPVDPADWTPVAAVPTTIVDAILTDGSTVYAASLNRVFVSLNSGGTWREATPLSGDAPIVSLALAGDRLFAGTLGDGVFESRDRGETWTPRSNGLVSQSDRRILAFSVRGNNLYAATDGAGVLVYNLMSDAGWTPFRTGMPSNLSWNVGDIVLAGGRLLAGAGGNGSVYLNDDGLAAWREVSYDVGFPGTLRIVFDAETVASAQPVVLLGGTSGLYRSVDRGETWARFHPGVGSIGSVSFAQSDAAVFAAVTNPSRGTHLFVSENDGAEWRHVVELRGRFVTDLKVVGDQLFSGRFDGLWQLPLSATQEE